MAGIWDEKTSRVRAVGNSARHRMNVMKATPRAKNKGLSNPLSHRLYYSFNPCLNRVFLFYSH
jgi:hypothetical protein